ncbi:MAG: hypothetical protein DRN88_05735 [Candidatus Hydrothermarchaeota archaeon]|nr:MAG: hypothetical protein DRN88_05735 [Candidatus Hydrothermarchaeota archaeon]
MVTLCIIVKNRSYLIGFFLILSNYKKITQTFSESGHEHAPLGIVIMSITLDIVVLAVLLSLLSFALGMLMIGKKKNS